MIQLQFKYLLKLIILLMYNDNVIYIISNELIDTGLNNVLLITTVEVLMYYHYNLYDYIITNYIYNIYI
jgi:sulfur relay (sulfurtransferase) DsrF/TusC family protein